MLLDLAICREVGFNPFQQLETELRVNHLATTETQRDFRLVSILQKPDEVTQFDLVVPNIGPRAKFDLLDLNLLELALGRVLALAFFVLKFAEIHNSTNWRFRIRRDLHEIECRVLCLTQSILCGNNSYLLAVSADQTDLRRIDSPVDANLFSCRDVLRPPKN